MKTIIKPELQSARKLSAAEMNNIHFSSQRTVLTPDMLTSNSADNTKSIPSPTPDKADNTDINFG